MSNGYRIFVPADKILSGSTALQIRRQLPTGALEYVNWNSLPWEADLTEPSPNAYVYMCSIYEYFQNDFRYGTGGTAMSIPEITVEIISTSCSVDADVANNYFYTTNIGQGCANPIGFKRYYAANRFSQPAYTAEFVWGLYLNSGFTGVKLNNGTASTIGLGKTQYALNATWSGYISTSGVISGVESCVAPTTTTTTTVTEMGNCYQVEITTAELTYEGDDLYLTYREPSGTLTSRPYTSIDDQGGYYLGVQFIICATADYGITYKYGNSGDQISDPGWTVVLSFSTCTADINCISGPTTTTTTTQATTTTTTTLCPSTYYELSLGYHLTDPSLACSSSGVTIYGNASTFLLSTRLYSDSACTYAVSGYYSDGTNYRYWNSATTQLSVAGTCSLIPQPTTTTTTTLPVPDPQPSGFVFARSPIVYRFRDLNPNNFFRLDVYIDTTQTLNVIYATIDRSPDLTYGVTIDVANLLLNYMRNNFYYDKENVVYFKTILTEYNGETIISTQTSDVGKASMGYNNVINGYFNWSISDNTIMAELPENLPFTIPTNINYSVPFKFSGQISWNTSYTTTTGTVMSYNTIINKAITEASEEIYRIPCGYLDLPNDIDVRKNISITVNNRTYILAPQSCAKNDTLEVKYLNKFGMWDYWYFSGRRDDAMTVTFERYKFYKVDYDAMTYDSRSGGYHKFSTQGLEKIQINTNWISETKNPKVTEFVLSERVLIGDIPYVIVDQEVKYKTERNEKLINYVFVLEKAYNAINNIR